MLRAFITGSLITVLAAASAPLAFAAGDGESDHPHLRHQALLETFGSSEGGFLGVQLTEITPELRTFFGVPDDVGVMVSRVVSESPAERAGLQVGDIIARAGDEDVDSSFTLQRVVGGHGGEAMVLEIWRDGQMQTLTANLENRKGFGSAFPRAFALACEEDDCPQGLVRGLPGRQDLVHGLLRHRGEGALFGCPEDVEECAVTVRCKDGDCKCTLNGAAADCEELRVRSFGEPHERDK